MMTRYYEVSCDYCGHALNHYIDTKPSREMLKEDGMITTATVYYIVFVWLNFAFGQERVRGADSIDRAYCFDYEMLKLHYNINLEVVMDSDNADEDDKDIPQTKEINF